jgi:pullulanase
VHLAPPAHLRQDIRAIDELEVTFHYYRYDGDYSGWNLWIWGTGEPGRSLEFVGSDAYGHVARTVLKQQTDGDSLGFILRKSVLGQSWACKDGEDRQIPLYWTKEDGTLEVWLMQGDPHIYWNADDVDRTPRLTKAVLEDVQTLRVETYLPVLGNLGPHWGFELTCLGEGERTIPLAEVKPLQIPGQGPGAFVLQTEIPLDLQRQYVLKHPTHGNVPVTFGGVFSSCSFYQEFHYSGHDLGANYSKTETTFKVWAPTAHHLEIVIYRTYNQEKGERFPLERGEKGVWWCTVKGDLDGVYYNYLVNHGEETWEVVDPYARATGPNGKRGQVVDLRKTNPDGWETLPWLPLESPVDAVIYEVHIRDFSISPSSGIKAQGQYLGLIEEGTRSPQGVMTGLDHLKQLGITHVHFMPIFDFATVDEEDPDSSYNWGYDPLNYNVPEGSYASTAVDGRVRIRELKTMIQGLNQSGIGVIMDVVYNHTFHSLASSFHRLVPGYYYRHNHDGSFSNGSGCGNEVADERSMVRKFIVDSVTYWAKEYKLGGFRFDLMGLHHLETMQAVRRAMDLISPQILLYGEGWAAAESTLPGEERALKENTVHIPGIASFCSDLRDGLKGHVFHTREGGFIQGQGLEETVKFGIEGAVQHPQIDYSQILYSRGPWAIAPTQSVAYAEAHDNLTLWDKLLCTTGPDEEGNRLKMMKLAHAILLTSQGIPFLHAGQDFARTKGGDPNSYQSPDHVNQMDWDRKGEFFELFRYTKALIQLRKERPAFRLRRGPEVRDKLRFLQLPQGNMVGYALGPHAGGDPFETILAFFNSNKTPVEVTIPEGQWTILVNDKGVGTLGTVTGPKVWVEAISPLVLGGREVACE